MRIFGVSKLLDPIFGVTKTLGLIFRGQQRNSGTDPPVLKVREYPPWGSYTLVFTVFKTEMLMYQSKANLNDKILFG